MFYLCYKNILQSVTEHCCEVLSECCMVVTDIEVTRAYDNEPHP